MQTVKQYKTIGKTPSGVELGITEYIIDSGTPGRTVYIQSGMHGGEITQWIMHGLYGYLAQNLKSGRVMLVPCANPASWLERTYFSTNGKFDMYMGKDWNRNFPGKADGTLGERIAAALFSMARQADFALDLHTSRYSLPFTLAFSRDVKKYAEIAGLEYNQLNDLAVKPSYADTINAALAAAGVPSLCIECGSHDAYEPENISTVSAGIKRILRALDMVDGDFEPAAAAKQVYFEKTVTYRAENGGFVRLAAPLGGRVSAGDDLYYLYDSTELGRIKTVKSEHDGILFKVSPTHIYWPGDEVLQLIENSAGGR